MTTGMPISSSPVTLPTRVIPIWRASGATRAAVSSGGLVRCVPRLNNFGARPSLALANARICVSSSDNSERQWRGRGWTLLWIARIVVRRLFGFRARLLLSRPVIGVRNFGFAGIARGATIGHYHRAERNRHGLLGRTGVVEQSSKLVDLPALF